MPITFLHRVIHAIENARHPEMIPVALGGLGWFLGYWYSVWKERKK